MELHNFFMVMKGLHYNTLIKAREKSGHFGKNSLILAKLVKSQGFSYLSTVLQGFMMKIVQKIIQKMFSEV